MMAMMGNDDAVATVSAVLEPQHADRGDDGVTGGYWLTTFEQFHEQYRCYSYVRLLLQAAVKNAKTS